MQQVQLSLAEHFSNTAEEKNNLNNLPFPSSEEAVVARKPKPCRNFTWEKSDSTEKRTGLCECGFHKSEHEREDRGMSMRLSNNLFNIGKKISHRISVTKGKVILAQPNGVACDDFRLNLQGEQYGLCKCGFNKLDHRKMDQERAQLVNVEKVEVDQRTMIELRNTSVPCTTFCLDLQNKEGYGYCMCGFRRGQHMDFSSKGDFLNVILSQPKDFI